MHVINYSRDALHQVAGHVVALAHAEDLPAHGAAVSRALPRGELMGRFDGLPIRDELKSFEPYGAPQLDVPILLNVNENPYPPSEETVADIAAAVTVAARG